MSDISVLVPSYNHARFVERTLRSIFNQTLKPRKLIVIDDGSHDGSPEIIERVLLDCPFESEFIVRENKGLCATLNEGYSTSKGDYFAYLGSDDLWLPDFLKLSTELLKVRRNACLSFGDAYLIDDEDFILDETENWHSFADGDLLPDLLNGKIFPSAGVAYRRDFLPEKPWKEELILEDYDLYLRLAGEYEFARYDEILCAWRQHEKNTSSNLPKMFPEFMKAHKEATERLGLPIDESRRLQKKLNFEGAFGFVRQGFKIEALRYLLTNAAGAQSPKDLIRLLFRILVPRSVFQWNRKRKHREARKRNGKLDTLATK